MKTTVAAILATFAALGARADEINLKSLAVNWDDSGTTKFVLGTGDYSDSIWNWTKERVFDGVIELDNGGTPDWRWFEPGWVNSENENAWAGYGVTEPVATVTGTEYTDTSIASPTKGTYTYRIASIDGSASVAYTLDVVLTGTPSSHGFAIFVQ